MESREDFAVLEEKVLKGLIEKAFREGDHETVARLYGANTSVVKRQNAPEMIKMIAGSLSVIRLYSDAVELYEELVNLGHVCDDCVLKRAELHFLAGDIEAAKKILSREVPDGSRAKSRLLGRIAAKEGDHVGAIGHFSQAMKGTAGVSYEDLEWFHEYVDSLLKADRPLESLKWADDALGVIKKDDVDLKVKYSLFRAAALKELKRFEDAAAVIEGILALDAGSDLENGLIYQLATLYLQAGMEAKAVEKFTTLWESGDPFWQSVAKQQLDYLTMRREGYLDL